MTEKQQKLYDYFILCARALLGFMLINYGWGKLTDGQFGISAQELNTPVKDLNLFRLSWYLFDQQPFKAFIGVSQIIAGLLLFYNRTLLLGALIAIPIWANILVIDITYVRMPAFYWRLSYYLALDFLILWHYRDRMLPALKMITTGISTKFKYRWWTYAILPVMVIVMELLGTIPKTIAYLVIYPSQTLHGLAKIDDVIGVVLRHLVK